MRLISLRARLQCTQGRLNIKLELLQGVPSSGADGQASSISGGKQKQDIERSVVFATNNTAVHEVFDRSIKSWDSMYKSKAYVHVFEQDGISVQDLMESRNIVQYISDAYTEFARWEDKFFEEMSGGPKPVIRERAIDNDEQRNIAQELKELWHGEMYIKVDPSRAGGQL
ncbi:Tubulin alpha-6 chain [Symbiodinium microadriaticum]|uniref:Tubulin alpha-6 chain n=1 Tax=Symbiodinium microadriaticum TaxID=2951 RepID=A0A1Q9DGT6_SYMMI|nr:Tubulin alpha-6 chain [Symbiodinium microadriaticum]